MANKTQTSVNQKIEMYNCENCGVKKSITLMRELEAEDGTVVVVCAGCSDKFDSDVDLIREGILEDEV